MVPSEIYNHNSIGTILIILLWHNLHFYPYIILDEYLHCHNLWRDNLTSNQFSWEPKHWRCTPALCMGCPNELQPIGVSTPILFSFGRGSYRCWIRSHVSTQEFSFNYLFHAWIDTYICSMLLITIAVDQVINDPIKKKKINDTSCRCMRHNDRQFSRAREFFY